MDQELDKGNFVGHVACPLDTCSSSDAAAVYQHDNGTHSFYCWSCKGHASQFDITNQTIIKSRAKPKNWERELEKLELVRDSLEAQGFKERMINKTTYDMYGCRMELDSSGDTVDAIYYPTYRDNEHVGYRNRRRFKEGHKRLEKKPELLGKMKNFQGGIGDTNKGIEMYGQHLFKPGGKRIIVTCGEEDAHAVWRMTDMMTSFEGGYPAVSVPSGEDISWIKPNRQYLASFDEIYLVADPDKAGKAFEEEFCKIMPVGKVNLVRLPKGVKDPSDLWRKNGGSMSSSNRKKNSKAFWSAIWQAEKYSPAGVMSLSEGWRKYLDRGKEVKIQFPDSFGELNFKTFGGYALGEIINIIAPSSVGKSSFVKEMIYSALETTNYNVGIISLEETIDEFIEGMLSVHMSEQLNEVSYDERDRGREWDQFNEMLKIRPDEAEEVDSNLERMHFLDHQGSCTGEELLEKIDFLINGLDCKVIIVDPVTLAFSGRDTDEDEMASEIVKRVKRNKVAWINVHHVRKNSNGAQANSEGASLTEEDIKGTGAWFQVADINLIFTRNKVHDHPIVRNTTGVKMSKCRRHGKNTGPVGWIYYNPDTGRLEEGTDPETTLENNPVEEEEWPEED